MKKLLPTLFLPALLASCAPERADRYNTAESASDVISLFNEGDYGKAIWLLENRHGKEPADASAAFLLGQAYLGRAKFEPLAFAARVSGAQNTSSEAARAFFRSCSPEPQNKLRDVEPKCLLKRIYLQAPEADLPDFARARALFRKAYPDPSRSPEWVNTLVGLVESVSLVRRAGDLYLLGRGLRPSRMPQRDEIQWLKHNGKESLREAKESLNRAEYAGDRIAKLLTGLRENPWYQKTESGIRFAERLGLPRFLQFVQDHLLRPSDELRYGEILDKLRALLDEEEKALEPR